MDKLQFTNTNSDGVVSTSALTVTVDGERHSLDVPDDGVVEPPNEAVRDHLVESDSHAVVPLAPDGEVGADPPLVESDPEELTEAQRLIDTADYQTLRAVAGEFDDISGNQSKSEIRVDLHTEAGEGEVVEAFETVGESDSGADTEASE